MADQKGSDKLSIVGNTEEEIAEKLEALNKDLTSDSKAVQLGKNESLSRQPSKSSLNSVNSDESRSTSNQDTNTLCVDSERKHTRWPSFTNAFPSFLNSSSGSAPLSSLSLWHQWDTVVNNWDQYSKKKPQVAELIKKGIPDEFRAIAWQLYSGAYESPLKRSYRRYLRDTSPFERAIRRDISRTYPKHDFFKDKESSGQTSLFNVMKAYSLHDREVGYCQGSGFIVGLLLMQMNEEDAFVVLVQLMNDYHLRELYKPCMSELGVCMHQLDGLVAEFLPELHTHFVSQSFVPNLYASAWFLTLFATAFPLSMATRVMDLFIAEGMDFILRLSLSILKQFAPRLLSMDMETMIFSLQQTDCDEWEDHGRELFENATALKLNQRKLKKLRNEYIAARSQERGEQIELRRLRTENGLLLQRLARMEEDNNYLAGQLVDCNLQRAELAEEVSRVRGDLARWHAKAASALTATTDASPVTTTLTNPLPPQAPTLSAAPCDTNGISFALVPVNRVSKPSKCSLNAPPSHPAQCRSNGDPSSLSSESITSGVASWTSLSPESGRGCLSSDRLILETINQLETDLVHVRFREAETNSSLRDAREKIRILEERLEHAIRRPMEKVELLQEELMKVKLREAEGYLQMKEFRQRVDEIRRLWEANQADRQKLSSGDASGIAGGGFLRSSAGLIQSKLLGRSSVDTDTQHLSDRLLEAKYLGQIAELNQKVRELLAQEEISTKQAARHDEQLVDLHEKLERSALREGALRAELKQAECSCADLEAKRKSDGIMWRIREIELNSQLAELRQHYAELDCLHDAEFTSNVLIQGSRALAGGPCDSTCSSVAPTPEVTRATASSVNLPGVPAPKYGGTTPKALTRRPHTAEGPACSAMDRISSMWKDLPQSIMTDSIGPLEDICILPDDPMITSIYLDVAANR